MQFSLLKDCHFKKGEFGALFHLGFSICLKASGHYFKAFKHSGFIR